MRGEVEQVCQRNAVVRLNTTPSFNVEGIPAGPDGTTCLDYAGVYGCFPINSMVYLNDTAVGRIIKAGEYFSTYKTLPGRVYVNGRLFKGITWSNNPQTIRLLPKGYGLCGLKNGDQVSVLLD